MTRFGRVRAPGDTHDQALRLRAIPARRAPSDKPKEF